jgi:hypothetical protein
MVLKNIPVKRDPNIMVKTKDNILADYEKNVQAQQLTITRLKDLLNNLSIARLGAFVAEILIVALIISFGYFWYMGVLIALPVFLFLALVKKQTKLQKQLDYALKLFWVYQNELDHIVSRSNRYDDGEIYSNESHPYSSDLDITGPGSLFAYINRCKTTEGLDLLAAHLLNAGDKATLSGRQAAIAELAGRIDQTYHFRAQLQDHQPAQLAILKDKLENQLPAQLIFTQAWFIRFYIVAGPLFMMTLFLSAIVLGGIMWKVFALGAVLNGSVILYHLSAINKIYYGFSGSSSLLTAFSETIKWQEDIDWESVYIRNFLEISSPAKPLSGQIKSLAHIVRDFDARLNLIVGATLNMFLVWDLRCAVRLAKWHKNSSAELIAGLSRISKFEELISFATLSYNHPDWEFPTINDAFSLDATGLGHPLIPEKIRVSNDFSLSHLPSADIVTGSNMAGKSTFLRTVGINMVLAFAGAPVCAKDLSLSVFSVLSYMRIKDSLNDQTSTFKAELNRLKMILDSTTRDSNSFVLIDEMLRGTNSRDKYLGSKVFIEKLISQKNPVLFATHDLQLSEMEADHHQEVRNYHFDIQISGGEMHFDYKLKSGPCKTFNAALLLKQIGLTLS